MPVSGAWRLTYSMVSHVSDGENVAYLFINGKSVPETQYRLYTRSNFMYGIFMYAPGSREVTLEASAEDQIEIRIDKKVDLGWFEHIYFCAEFIPKM